LRWAYKQYDTKATAKKEEERYNYAVPEKQIDKNERKEKMSEFGFLLVISGASGAGKDTILAKLIEHPSIKVLNLKKVVTCTDRSPREGERCDIDYHFLSGKELDGMAKRGELIEEITLTGSSRKATPRSEIERLFKGEDLVWRIDPSRAAEIATGDFFQRLFGTNAPALQKNTLVLCITAAKDVIETRRKHRDGEKYNPNEYKVRDEQEEPYLRILAEKAVLIESVEGNLEEIVENTAKFIVNHHAKIKNKKI
jgi:guanylate kinase